MNLIPVIPESAPFSSEQRAWLNGFFAGILGLQGQSISEADRVLAPAAFPAAAVEEDLPWHDASLPIAERMALAEGKPLARRMMAAMAQLDCGACGYLCKTYSEAIANGQEVDLSRCTPGGKETARKLKELQAESKANAPSATIQFKNGAVESTTNGAAKSTPYSRQNPLAAKLLYSTRLNGPGSEKDVRLVAIDLVNSGLTYQPGDSLGVLPANCQNLVNAVLGRLQATGNERLSLADGATCSFREALVRHAALNRATVKLVQALAAASTKPVERERLIALAEEDGDELDRADLLDLLLRFPSVRPEPAALVEALPRMQPRLYSIASSLAAHPNEVHLTVGTVRYQAFRRHRKGVCSTYLADRLAPGDEVRVFVQPSHGFRLPPDPTTPVIMIGPGTGIAPFRAFLQERAAQGAKGQNWLIFGDQRADCDFLFRRELSKYRDGGLLTRLDTAFSRDQAEKLYVQHRLLEQSAEIWRWLEAGACLYVCGDAKRMAPDVDKALQEIVSQQGRRDPAEAKSYLQLLGKANRYRRDVY